MPDFARVLSQYVDGIVIRANRHQTVADLAAHSTCPVINGLTDYAHPCQALADLYTLRELVGRLNGLTLAYVGDCNNMASSLVEGCGRLGMKIVVASPKAYQFSADDLARFQPRNSRARSESYRRPHRCREGRRGDLYRRLGQHGPGIGKRQTQSRFRRVSGECRAR